MNISLYLELSDFKIPLDYHKSIVSLIKKSLTDNDKELFDLWYNASDPIAKPFCFSVYLPNSKFSGEYIELTSKKIVIHFKILLSEEAVRLMNAFRNEQKKNQTFLVGPTRAKISKVYAEMLKEVNETHLVIRMASPLVARLHDRKTNQSSYICSTDEDFETTVKLNINATLSKLNIDVQTDDFSIKPVKANKTIVKLYNGSVLGNLGIFEIKGSKELLNILYQIGIGSLRSSGFGNFEILK